MQFYLHIYNNAKVSNELPQILSYIYVFARCPFKTFLKHFTKLPSSRQMKSEVREIMDLNTKESLSLIFLNFLWICDGFSVDFCRIEESLICCKIQSSDMPTAAFGIKENRRFHPFPMTKHKQTVRLKSISGVQLENVNSRISSLIKVTLTSFSEDITNSDVFFGCFFFFTWPWLTFWTL